MIFLCTLNEKIYLYKQLKSDERVHAKSLKRNCATRWIERFHSVHDFLELFECVIDSLDIISDWNDGDTSSQVNNFKHSTMQGEFIISLFILSKLFAIGLPLSKQF